MISFDEAFDWFYAFERDDSVFRFIRREEEIFLLQVIEQKIAQENYSKACRVIQYLKSYQSSRATGDEKGEVLLILESMKMQNELKAPRAGKVSRLRVKPGDRVEKRETLLSVV